MRFGSYGGQDEGLQAGGELVGVGVALGERPEQRLGDVAERVGAGVAVLGTVGQVPRPTGIDHDDEGPAHRAALS